jgi:hypothetical protein
MEVVILQEYHKIQTVYKRDPETKHKTLLEGDFSLPEFEYLKDNEWIFTEKVDGTNIRIMWQPQEEDIFKFGGKTDNAQIPTLLYSALTRLTDYDKFASVFNTGIEDYVCLYGEGYGAKIQKGGGNYRQDQSFVLFDIKIGDWWLQRKDVKEIAQKLELEVVPIIGKGTLKDMVQMAKAGFNSQWGDFLAEGIVARPATELKTRSGHRLITKIKHKDFKSVSNKALEQMCAPDVAHTAQL